MIGSALVCSGLSPFPCSPLCSSLDLVAGWTGTRQYCVPSFVLFRPGYSRPQAVFLPAGAAAPVPPASAGARQDAPISFNDLSYTLLSHQKILVKILTSIFYVFLLNTLFFKNLVKTTFFSLMRSLILLDPA